MHIQESFICGKHTAADCEDGMVITPHFAAVIDGSTSKTPMRLNPTMKNGRFAMLIISDYIQQMPVCATIDDFCQGVTMRIANEYAQLGITAQMTAHPEERLTASAIIYSHQRQEVWMVGDCQAIIDNKYYDNSKPFEQEIALQRANLIKNGMSPTEARRTITHQSYARRTKSTVCRYRWHTYLYARHSHHPCLPFRGPCLRWLPHSASYPQR